MQPVTDKQAAFDYTMETIRLPRTLVNQILRHAQSSPEDEVCGLIAAAGGRPDRAYRIDNVAGDRRHLFHMDPQQLIDAMREMRARGEELFAIYHSHPDSDAVPSARDLAEDQYPQALYLIVSLNTKGVLEMRGYRFDGERMEMVELEI
jgi:proteasome lid subunit RPN8/RPN11